MTIKTPIYWSDADTWQLRLGRLWITKFDNKLTVWWKDLKVFHGQFLVRQNVDRPWGSA